jgi:hypothetical protein
MIVPQQFRCDTPGCTATHSESNRWFAIRQFGRRTELYSWEDAISEGVLAESSHFCGQTHALQFVSSLMGKQESK